MHEEVPEWIKDWDEDTQRSYLARQKAKAGRSDGLEAKPPEPTTPMGYSFVPPLPPDWKPGDWNPRKEFHQQATPALHALAERHPERRAEVRAEFRRRHPAGHGEHYAALAEAA